MDLYLKIAKSKNRPTSELIPEIIRFIANIAVFKMILGSSKLNLPENIYEQLDITENKLINKLNECTSIKVLITRLNNFKRFAKKVATDILGAKWLKEL